MQISALETYIDDIANTDTSAYSSAKKKTALSRWGHIILEEVIDAQDDWDFQGEIATASLVANQREYVFPSDILKIKKIELKLDGTNWKTAEFTDESQITCPYNETDIIANFTNDTPFVTFYDNSFFIWSGTITAVTGGIRIWYSEEVIGTDSSGDDVSAFSADTDSPNLPIFAQMALVYGAISDWAETRDPVLAGRMNIRLYGHNSGRPADSASVGGLIGRIRDFFSRRIQDKKVIITSSSRMENYE